MIISRDEIIFDNEEQKKEVETTSKFYNSKTKEELEHLETKEREQKEKEYLNKVQKESEIIDF
jgi:hypothetical protein